MKFPRREPMQHYIYVYDEMGDSAPVDVPDTDDDPGYVAPRGQAKCGDAGAGWRFCWRHEHGATVNEPCGREEVTR